MPERPVIYTIGHGDLDQETLIMLLHQSGALQVADVRRIPGSRKCPHFNKDVLENVLPTFGLLYTYWPGIAAELAELTDRKAPPVLNSLMDFATERPTALLCREMYWKNSNRSMIADVFTDAGWKVMHVESDRTKAPVEHHGR